MKPSNNNLGVILTYAVPTAAALLGLLWLLRRRRGQDGDDDDSTGEGNKHAQKERSGIVTAPSTLPRERHRSNEALDSKQNKPRGDFASKKVDAEKKEQVSAGIMKTGTSYGRSQAAGDGSIQRNTAYKTSSRPASSDRGDQTAAAAHSLKVSSVLTSILPASGADRGGGGDDPVQKLVNRNEEKLKADDTSILQAKLSTSTLQSLPPSKVRFSAEPAESRVKKELSCADQESEVAKEIVQEVLTKAARVHAESMSACTSSVTSAVGQKSELQFDQDSVKHSQQDGSEGWGRTSDVGSLGAEGVKSNLVGGENSWISANRNSNNSNNNSISDAVADFQSGVEVSRADILLQTSAPEEKLTKKDQDQIRQTSKSDSKPDPSAVQRNNQRKDSSKVKATTGSAEFNSRVLSSDKSSVREGSSQDVQSKDKVAEKKSSDSPSAVKSNSPSANARTSPPKQGGKTPPSKSDKLLNSQSKASSQPKSKSTPPASSSNSYSSKRRTRSGSSTEGQRSEGSFEGQDGVSQASPGVVENGRLPDSGSPVCDSNSEASNDSGRGGSVGETLVPLSGGEVVRYEFNFPSELCGRLIGRGGKNIQQVKEQSGANVTLSSNPFTPDFQICCVQGLQPEVDRALMLIRKKFPLAQFPLLDMASLAPPPPAPVVLPEIMQLNLPEGVSVDIVVSAIVNAGHIFVQQPTHPTFPSLERLNHFMNACYGDQNVPLLPRPVEGGIICAAESEGQWYRAQVVQVYPAEDECDIKFVDYGGYNRVPINTLKQIRSDFMTLPFQAVECYLANITPLQDEEYFSDKAGEVLGELTSGKMLQGQVIARGEDSICYVHLYQVSGHSVLMINREMVNREVVRWIEIL